MVLLAMITPHLRAATPREGDWKKVEEAEQQGLPQSALTALEPILRAALGDGAWAEATRALIRKVALEADIQGGRPEEKIRRLEAALSEAPAEMRPLLHTVLATWYWQYFQENRWRFLQRTATAEAPGEDFTTWDLRRLFAAIDGQFTAALAADHQLQATPVAVFDEFLSRGSLPDAYRPTLYDFIAHEALAFYTSGEQAGARPQDTFTIPADSPIFDDTDALVAWKPVTAETNAPALRAIELYQALLAFHRHDADPTARLDVDLARLVWGNNVAFGEAKDARYQAALKRFSEVNGDHELAALALHYSAEARYQEGEFTEAHELARRGAAAHPASAGGKLCANLVARIEGRSASVVTERVWNAPWPAVQVRYRNVTNIWFRAVPWDWDEFLDRRHRRPENLSTAERNAVLSRPPALAWSHPLPPTTDFREHVVDLPAPTSLQPGFYFLVASHDATFSDHNNQLSMTDIWVSDLALVIRNRGDQLEGFVLEAGSGEPVDQAEVKAWHLDNQGNRIAVPTAVTDANGLFSLRTPSQRGVLIKATARGQSVATADESHRWQVEEGRRPFTQTVLFTDRALYRPGQTIQYKGICLRVDQDADNYATLSRERITLAFLDPNGQELARQSHRANDYGSFSGSFTAPRDRLLGQMQLVVVEGADGRTAISVEEYKRPKFQVQLEAPATAAKLGGDVQVPGQATAYTGAAIDGAEVTYRVVRQVVMPWWWGWGWRSPGGPQRESQEIAHGTLRTGTDGRFEIGFVAQPDRSVPESDEPTFEFVVYADVTDGAGETRSDSRIVRLGYTALQARLNVADWLTEDQPVRLEVRTTTLDGEPQVAEGVLKIHALVPPERVSRGSLGPPVRPDWLALQARPGGGAGRTAGTAAEPDLADPNQWPLGPLVAERGFSTDTNGVATVAVPLTAGAYRVLLETQDRFGMKVTGRRPLQVVNPAASRFGIKVPQFLDASSWEVQPGEEFKALWGTGYETGRAFIEIEHRGRFLERYWTRPGTTQAQIQRTVSEAMRGGFTLLVTFVRENRAYVTNREVRVPWRDKELELRWSHFTSKLQPGQSETWTLEIRSPKSATPRAEQVAAELVATLYDASLDAFAYHDWPAGFGVFREEHSMIASTFGNSARPFRVFRHDWRVPQMPVELSYRTLPPEIQRGRMVFTRPLAARGGTQVGMRVMDLSVANGAVFATAAPQPAAMNALALGEERLAFGVADKAASADLPEQVGGGAGAGPAEVDLSQVSARRNLNETAFFFPHLTSDSNGVVRLEFKLPEALTEWRFLGFAHDRTLRAGLLRGRAVTAKDLMVQPNPPRFLREGDVLEFTVKVTNLGDQPQRGQVRLTFNNGLNDEPADALLANHAPDQPFDVPARESRTFAWRLTVPDDLSVLTYKVVGASATLSDGEEGFLPVLSRRVLVTESLPLPIRGPATQTFAFTPLLESSQSPTLRHQSLTLQMVSQPAWYAVLALPYLMEFPYECSEQIFNRYYANALARFIANSDPKIRRVFDLWKNTPALDSPLEKNPELKSVLLEESPWLQQARNESQARKNVGVLFDDNRLGAELHRAWEQLREAQLPEGGWSWFPGGPRNDYITLYLVAGFGRLRHLGVDVSPDLALASLARLDAWLVERHQRILKDAQSPEDHVPGPSEALYLYGRSFFLQDQPLAAEHQPAVDFFLERARQHWLQTGNRQTQGHLALALQRWGDPTTAQAIVRSLKERSVVDPELGRFWRDAERSWWWYHAPIETQALMIEVFAEVAQDAQAVEDCQVWLLKQKQTQNWKTTKATADAVYALLLRGRNLLGSDQLVVLEVSGRNVTPGTVAPGERPDPRPAVEPGTGFYEVRFVGPEVNPEMGRITVQKTDAGVAWGSAHWQYFEDLARVPAYADTPLKLRKTLFTKQHTASGPVLNPVRESVAVGDELVVRLELRVDRDLEYVHLKDQRGSGTEPVNVLSQYRYQDGLAYYETTRDAATHFFLDYLPRGTYVFEYATRVQHRGEYQTGVATIQCLYAPEFNSHSESTLLRVR